MFHNRSLTRNLTLSLFLLTCLAGCDRNVNSNANIATSDNSEMSAGNNTVTVKMYKLEAGKAYGSDDQFVGNIVFEDGDLGMLIKPDLKKLKPGLHGFHIHNNPSCEPGEKAGKQEPGLGAGDHLDPAELKEHLGPYAVGHLGDLPALFVSEQGEATTTTLAPRLKVADLKDRAVIIHAGSDNYADTPAPLGGGGARQLCGVVDFSKALP